MKKIGKQLRTAIGIILTMALLLSMTVLAEGGSADNSLSSLGVENGTVLQEVEYGLTEYDVTVAPGTTELRLNPIPTDANASIVSIEGTTLGADGTATVVITVQAENGDQFPYYLYVKTDQSATPVTETATEAPQTETQPQQTEAPETENARIQELEANNRRLSSQVDEYKDTNDMQMKIIYGLAALAVILIFIIVNQILRNKDLKEDLKEIENHIDSHSKGKAGSADTYYTPQQGKGMPKYVPPVNNGAYQEETFRQNDKNPQDIDKIPAKKQTRAEKKAAKAEMKASKKAGKYEQQMMGDPAGSSAKRQPMRQPQNMMNNPANNPPMRQPQGNPNPQMMRQPQMGNSIPPQPMNTGGAAGTNMNHMGCYAGRAQQMNNNPMNAQQQPHSDAPASQEAAQTKVEVDMIDL